MLVLKMGAGGEHLLKKQKEITNFYVLHSVTLQYGVEISQKFYCSHYVFLYTVKAILPCVFGKEKYKQDSRLSLVQASCDNCPVYSCSMSQTTLHNIPFVCFDIAVCILDGSQSKVYMLRTVWLTICEGFKNYHAFVN